MKQNFTLQTWATRLKTLSQKISQSRNGKNILGFALVAIVASLAYNFAQPTAANTGTLTSPTVVPIVGPNGTTVGSVTLPANTKVTILQSLPDRVLIKTKMNQTTWVDKTSVTEEIPAANPTPTAATPTAQPNQAVKTKTKRVLYYLKSSFDQADRAIISGLEAKGVDVVVAARAGALHGNFDTKYPQSLDPPTRIESTAPAPTIEILFGDDSRSDIKPEPLNWDDIAHFDGFIFPASNLHKFDLELIPIEKILSSGKLVAMGGATTVPQGKERLRGTFKPKTPRKINPNKPPKPIGTYTYETSSRMVAWAILWWTPRRNAPTDQETQEFIDKKIIPAILTRL